MILLIETRPESIEIPANAYYKEIIFQTCEKKSPAIMPGRTQSYYNHRRIEPLYHYVLLPLSLAFLLLSLYFSYQTGFADHHWTQAYFMLMPGLILPLTVILFKRNDLRLQDRIIRLEIRYRYLALSGQPFNGMENKLTMDQIRALRFASDAELLPLIGRAGEEKLTAREIKKKIRNWKGDYYQV